MSGKEVHSLEDIQIGDNIGPEPLFLAKDRVRAYCDATGLHGVPRFTDDELARKEGLPGMITPGNISAPRCRGCEPPLWWFSRGPAHYRVDPAIRGQFGMEGGGEDVAFAHQYRLIAPSRQNFDAIAHAADARDADEPPRHRRFKGCLE